VSCYTAWGFGFIVFGRRYKMQKKANLTIKQLERIKDMKSNDMPTKEIARMFGVSPSTVTAYLRGERKPR
jgi:DNA-binding CsgD family transcriptional regulator